ncbi:MAG: radical SAM protein [Nitrospirae bacterium]|nr:radical SAM protein [Candidatus Manganitrophaceae bacterium]
MPDHQSGMGDKTADMKMTNTLASKKESIPSQLFRVVLIKPSHYDEEGYVIRWMRSCIPSNTLACLYTITEAVQLSGRLGPGIHLTIDVYDEINQRIPVNQIIRQLTEPGAKGIVCFAGVQSNQYPRTLDLAKPFRAAGVQTLIGGFHVSGCLSMLETLPEELTAAMADGITLVAGEVEEKWGEVLEDALYDRLKPLYNFMNDLPSLQGQPMPILPHHVVSRIVGQMTTFDAGRGCPFECSFCTIINVQGRKSRWRTADDIEAIIRENHRRGLSCYFITDDDFARNRNWESIFDRIILLRQRDKIKISLTIQVDTASHRLPRFIEKAAKAGCRKVFIGLENVNPETLKETGKKQNHVEEYREMLQAWRKANAVTFAGYIIGFPNDTYESVMRDVEVLKNELPLDLVEFFVLTPLPGSEDHQIMVKEGSWLDPDLNKYDTEHPCTHHPKMSEQEWMRAYNSAWRSFYTDEHIETIFRRRKAEGHSVGKLLGQMIWFCGSMFVERVHPLQAGVFRRKHPSERRPSFPREGAATFAWRRLREVSAALFGMARLSLKLYRISRRVENDPTAKTHLDLATTPTARKGHPLRVLPTLSTEPSETTLQEVGRGNAKGPLNSPSDLS